MDPTHQQTSVRSPLCVLPWVHLFGSADGKVYPCCFTSSFQTEVSGDSQEIDFQANRKRLEDQDSTDFSSPFYKNFRGQFLGENLPSFCEGCLKLEQRGGTSRRLEALEQFSSVVQEIQRGQDPSQQGILHAQFSLGNQCNLKCRMCNPFSSNQLISEWQELGFMENFQEPSQFFQSDEFWKTFFQRNPNLQTLVLAGGETLLTPRAHWLIDFLISANKAQSIDLELHSNLTFLPDEVFEKLQKFQSFKIMASIDGYNSVNNYIRFPSKWSQITANLQKLNDWCRNSKGKFSINVTVQAYNVLYLNELVRFALSFDSLFQLKLNVLTDPPELQLRALPESVRKLAANRIRELLQSDFSFPLSWKAAKREAFRSNLRSFLPMLESSASDPQLELAWRNRTQKVDKFRGQRMEDFLPELAELSGMKTTSRSTRLQHTNTVDL